MGINEVTVFLGWCSVLNLSVFVFAALFLFVCKGAAINVHSKLMGVSVSELPPLYFICMANYKIGILMFNLIPYLALKLMG